MPDRVIVIHKVADYQHWKQHFDAAAQLRKSAGEGAFEVLRSSVDPNLVVHAAEWSSHADARAFFESSEVQAIRQAAKVETPTFLYLDAVEAGTAGT